MVNSVEMTAQRASTRRRGSDEDIDIIESALGVDVAELDFDLDPLPGSSPSADETTTGGDVGTTMATTAGTLNTRGARPGVESGGVTGEMPKKKDNMNMLAAFAHLVADIMRGSPCSSPDSSSGSGAPTA